MTTLGTIGSGRIGGTVAKLAAGAGYDVVLSNSRGPETLKELVDQIGPRARAATPTEVAQVADLVLVSVPLRAYQSVPVEPLAGKVVMDTNNYYPGRDGHIAALDDGSATSSGLLQRHLPDAKVVKVFNNILFTHIANLARPAGAPDRSALAIAGDDAEAKATVAAFLDEIGWDAVDAGTLADSWRYQPDTPAYGLPYFGGRGWSPDDPGSPTAGDVIRAALAQATR
jgi:8-hydroxy-5-deazaflavin:NADPH oxidoreductase